MDNQVAYLAAVLTLLLGTVVEHLLLGYSHPRQPRPQPGPHFSLLGSRASRSPILSVAIGSRTTNYTLLRCPIVLGPPLRRIAQHLTGVGDVPIAPAVV